MRIPPFSRLNARAAEFGFTLIELMVAVGVAGILAAIAIPAFNNFVLNDRDASQINSLVYSFNYARSEAVKRNIATGVTVCPATAGACSNTNWSGGWIVTYLDTTGATPTQTVLQAVPPLAGNNILTTTSTGVTFTSTGALSPPGTTLAIKVCDPRGGNYGRDVEVNSIGGITTSQTPGKNAKGAALPCP